MDLAELPDKLKHNPADQPVGRRLMSKRLQMAQHEQIVHECPQIEEVCTVFANQLEVCRQMDAPVGVILIEIANFDELETFNDPSGQDVVSQVAKHILPVVAGHSGTLQQQKSGHTHC
jgi:hypothetical protein